MNYLSKKNLIAHIVKMEIVIFENEKIIKICCFIYTQHIKTIWALQIFLQPM